MRLVFVEDIAPWYEQARPFIQLMAEGSGGRQTEATFKDALSRKLYWLALAVEDDVRAAMIAQPITHPTGLRELWIWGLTGRSRADWIHLEQELRRVAKAAGFERLTATARPGWGRVMKDWRVTHHEMSMELT